MAIKEELTDTQWAKIALLLPTPPKQPRGGRPWAGNRAVFEGILWVLRSGARWRDLPERYPSPSTCWRRLKQWEDDGVWLDIWRVFLKTLDRRGLLSRQETFADGSFASAKKGAPPSARPSEARVRSGWWWSTAKVFLWEFTSTAPRQRLDSASPAEVRLLETTLKQIAAPRVGRGRPRMKPERVIADRAYDSDPLRTRLKRRGIELICPHRKNRVKPKTQDGRKLRRYTRRWKIDDHI